MLTAPSIARPAIAAVALLAAVALTGIVLWFWWPGGVALGLAVGAGSMLAVGSRMHRSNERIPTDDVLQQRLGVAEPAARPAPAAQPVTAPAVAAPTPSPVVEAPAVLPLSARADDAFFTTSVAVAPVAEPEAVAEPDTVPEPVAEPEPVASTPEPAPATEPEPAITPEPDVAPVPEPDPIAPAAAAPAPVDDAPEVIPSTDFVLTDDDADVTVRADLEHLKAELGDDYPDFARAARLVVATQYASAARLQRDLEVPYSRARRLLTDLEQQHFVGPATGSLPRVVLMPKDRLPEVERLLAEA